MKKLIAGLLLIAQVAQAGLITHTDYTAGNVITAAGQNNNENAIFNEFNGNIGTTNIATGGVATGNILDGTIAVADLSTTVVSTITAVQNFAAYRRPNLKFINITTVDVENNTSTSNQTCIIFQDTERRCVTEDTSSTSKYRRFDITATATFASGTMDSGLRSGITESANVRYAIYAVKCTASGETANFVLAGDTTFPTPANVATLNSRFGSNSYVFLGYIWNGNGQGGSSDIASFVQAGPVMSFTNTNSAGISTGLGVLLATTGGATTLTYTYAAGSGSTSIPDTITQVNWGAHWESVAGNVIAKDSGGNRIYINQNANSTLFIGNYWSAASEGMALSNGPVSSEIMDIFIRGYVDGALTSGIAPLF